MPIPKTLDSRIRKVGKIKDLRHVTHERHPETGRYEMTGITCKICHTVIAGPVDSGFHNKTQRINGREIIYRTMMFSRFKPYTEVELEFDDGSKHVTHLCKQCISRLDEPGMIEHLYVADLAQWVYEEQIGVHTLQWDRLDFMIKRRPTGKWTDLGGV